MELLTYMGSLLGLLAFLQGVMPPEFRYMLSKCGRFLFEYLSFYNYFDIYEFDGMNSNELYSCVQLHLSSSASTAAQRATLSRPKNSNKITFGLARSESVTETFRGAQVMWQHIITERPAQFSLWERSPDERRYYSLKIKKQDRERVLSAYLEHIIEHAKELQHGNRDKLLYTNAKNSYNFHRQPWESVPFKHPSTFSTLAMDPVKKQEIMEDLTEFMKGEHFYQRVGRAWKRGYLLYGPPGTGKSSMIAAIANFTGYDVYDMELTEVASNADLRKLLIKTTNRSIIVIEDIDCSLNLSDRKKLKEKKIGEPPPSLMPAKMDDEPSRVTLSGLLNFTDGLWSCCGSERIIIFTTNHIDKLDPALLRSGRMDMHIFMSHCTFPALKILATNYLGIRDHELYDDLELVLEESKVTPAEVSEILIKKKKFPTDALESLLETLRAARDEKRKEMTLDEALDEQQQQQNHVAMDFKDGFKAPADKIEQQCNNAAFQPDKSSPPCVAIS
ncbi:AAA-ATPase At4g25835-like [Selaginella moellendorffii]|uniref:AAA-ATPase At4g25835-like n=1 Tax=Selaginella moellendorffii TaxID=88036 RepID=UPI000D1C8801|nr:AAA-ATPase At4g25835-like [Selaginella moellendorffii]|eukprot:XP_024517137.1 AAA-ATPase At4g25835-like [Selaginella moellendorffii]